MVDELSIKRRYCFNCGTKLIDDANFCYHCGMNLNNPGQQYDCISSKSVDTAEFIIQDKFVNEQDEIVVRGIVPDKMEIRRNDIMALKKCDKEIYYVDIIRIESNGKEYAKTKVGQYVDIIIDVNERETELGTLSTLTVDFIDYDDTLVHGLLQISEIDERTGNIKVISPGYANQLYILQKDDCLCVMNDKGRVDECPYLVLSIGDEEPLPNIYNDGWGCIVDIRLSDVEGLRIGDWLCMVNEHYTVN